MNDKNLFFAIVFWLCFIGVAAAYFVYPLLIFAISQIWGRTPKRPALAAADSPTVSLLIAAYNEELEIGPRIRNALDTEYPGEKLDVIIASDGSDDQTTSIVRASNSARVRLLDFPERQGKATVLNRSFEEIQSEIVVLSDANTRMCPKAIRRLAAWFSDPSVGVVCGRLVLTDRRTGSNVDGLYWRYENFLKNCEGKLGALLGANGGIYAIRREMFEPIHPNTIIDDFVLPLRAKLKHNCRIVYDIDALAWEETPSNISSEFHRRARIGAGGFQSIFWLGSLLNPRQGWTSLAFLFHKVLRWSCPFLLLTMLASNLALLDVPFYRIVFAAHLGFYAMALAASYAPRTRILKPLRLSSMFVSMNIALLVGFWRWISSAQTGVWKRTARSDYQEVA